MLYAGVDEVGRGCLAGPVVACAIILPQDFSIAVADSKQCSKKRRSILSEILQTQSISYGIGVVDNTVIDRVNIRNATFMAMAQAISFLKEEPSIVYIDGNACIPDDIMLSYNIHCDQSAIIKGDATHQSIASASIVAKVFRDELMVSFANEYPEYGFELHKGYGTKYHLQALQEYGSCAIHRKTFAGVV